MKQSFWLRYSEKLDRTMYWVIGGAGLCSILWLLADHFWFAEMSHGILGPCLVYRVWHVYCPGCGGTRAVYALLQGKPIASFCCHPFVPYAVALGSIFLFSRTVAGLRRRPERGVHFRYLYFGIGIALYLVHFLVKNILLLGFEIDIFEMIAALPC